MNKLDISFKLIKILLDVLFYILSNFTKIIISTIERLLKESFITFSTSYSGMV